MKATRKLIPAIAMLLVSAVMLSTASFAWFTMNTQVKLHGMTVQASSDSTYLQIGESTSQEKVVAEENMGLALHKVVTSTGDIELLKVTPVTDGELNNFDEPENKFVGKSYYRQTHDGHLIAQEGTLEQATNLANYFVNYKFTPDGSSRVEGVQTVTINASSPETKSTTYWVATTDEDVGALGGYKKVVVSTEQKKEVTVTLPVGAYTKMTAVPKAGSGAYKGDGKQYYEAKAGVPTPKGETSITETIYKEADVSGFTVGTIFEAGTYVIAEPYVIDNPAYVKEFTEQVAARTEALANAKKTRDGKFNSTSEGIFEAYLTAVGIDSVPNGNFTTMITEIKAALTKYDAEVDKLKPTDKNPKETRNKEIEKAIDKFQKAVDAPNTHSSELTNLKEAILVSRDKQTSVLEVYDAAFILANDTTVTLVENKYKSNKTLTTPSGDVATSAEEGYCFVKANKGESYYKLTNQIAGNRLIGQVAWFTAYSTKINDAQGETPVSPIDAYEVKDKAYYLTAEFTDIHVLSEKNATDFKISNVIVESTDKVNDTLVNTIRVLVVADKLDGNGKVIETKSCVYKNRDNSIAPATLFDTLASDEKVNMNVYIYFDGTDADARTNNIPLTFKNYAVELKVSVNENQG